MKHLLLSILLVSFSSALADTPAKIAEDYRKAAAAAVSKLNETLEQAATPLISQLVVSGDTAGAEQLAAQIKAKLAGEAVPKPQASATQLFAQYDQARVKALEPAQKASISRIEGMLKSASKPNLETVTELGKVRAEIDAASVLPGAEVAISFPMHWSYHMKPDRLENNGSLDMKPDGTLFMGSTPGQWSATSQANVLDVVLDIDKSRENCQMRINGNEAELVRPIGTRYLKAKPEPVTVPAEIVTGKAGAAAMPALWTYHATERPDGSVGPAHGELHFHPDGTVTINDLANAKIPHTGLWKANSKGDKLTLTVQGFGEWKMEIQGTTGSLDRPDSGLRYLRVKAPKA